MTTSLPQFSDIADQRYFLEPLEGGVDIERYLRRFPSSVYNKSPDSHLVRFLYALLGPTGVGWLKANLAEARLLLEAHGAAQDVLDTIYGVPFSFPRLPQEVFTDDTSGMLLQSLWQAIRAQDEAYRSRALKFFQGVRLGGTVQGLTLIASAGLGEPVDIIENYRFLFDVHSDDPLGLPWVGATTMLEEFVVLPRPTISQSEEQGIRFDLFAPTDSYTVVFNGSAVTLPLSASAGDIQTALVGLSTIGVGNAIVTGGPFPGAFYVLFTGNLSNQALPLLEVYFDYSAFTASGTQGSPVLTAATPTTGIPTEGQTVIGPGIPPDTTLMSMTADTWTLSNAYTALDGSQTFSAASYVPITVRTGVTDPSIEAVVVSPAAQHGIQTAVDLLRPVPTYPTWGPAKGKYRPQQWRRLLASTEYVEVVRFVTGSRSVSWPPTDTMHWIEASVENEAPQLVGAEQQHYVNFHNVASVHAYTDAALTDPNYATDSSVLANYNSTHVGPFPEMAIVIPYFAQFATAFSTVFTPSQALSDFPDQLRVTNQTDAGLAVINRIYPADYADLQGAPHIAFTDADFWSSLSRASGADILEIDLGSPQAVNYISLEITRKPVAIQIDYDLLDQSPSRSFAPVTMISGLPVNTSVYFDPSQQNPWEHLTFSFTDSRAMIFTRFIRLTLTRLAGSQVFGPFLFDQATQTQIPWSVEVRNLRIGRNVAPSVV